MSEVELQSVKQMISDFSKLSSTMLSYENLGEIVRGYNFEFSDVSEYLSELDDSGSYARNILLMDPLELVLIRWPVGCSSALHLHEGFYGYVVVLQGTGIDQTYQFENGTLLESMATVCTKNGLISEPDGVLHEIKNGGNDELVTLHIYYPALKTLEDMQLFDLEQKKIGVLNASAKTASWLEDSSAFKSVTENAFNYHAYSDQYPNASHQILLISPRPERRKVEQMIASYYDEQAEEYDNFDQSHSSRSAYIEKIDQIIGDDLKEHHPLINFFLTLACGTGRRSINQRDISGLNYEITGIDLSEEMCKQANMVGLSTINGSWLDIRLDEKLYDAASFLYAFGHIPDYPSRLESLKKIHDHLAPGSPVYLDAFSLYDETEWGPWMLGEFKKRELVYHGFDEGDIYYKKIGGESIAYLHYFSEDKLRKLFTDVGFKIEWVKYIGYTVNSGEEVSSSKEGFFFVKAIKA